MCESLRHLLMPLQTYMSETSDYIFQVHVPGLSRDDLHIHISPDRVMSIQGKTLHRSFYLPEDCEMDHIRATLKDQDMLHILVPKKQYSHRLIHVNQEFPV